MVKTNQRRDLGAVIKQTRAKAQLTLQELSNESGVSPSHIARIESGERYPSAKVLLHIAKPLGLPLSEIYSMAGYLPPPPVGVTDYGIICQGLDPEVAKLLAKEPIAVQKKVIKIISLLKNGVIDAA